MRAIIRVTIRETTDEKAIEVKKKVEELVKALPDVEVELTLLAR